ncbi:phage tail tape measure protein [Bacillus sp. FJAT-22090]|uniref:phage tail tape measure protein n=1 Tax=Bacillus sp. FJAT-22090 TaxID=1581038 RepID=UPI001642679C|nr:phage tail tape measure protein [Bacillus sp. FJAT-22090]
MANTNNSLELLVKLGIDTSNKTDLQSQVSELGRKLEGLKVDIKLDPKVISNLEKLTTMDFSKLSSNFSQAVDKINKETKQSANKIQQEYEKAGKKASAELSSDLSKVFKKEIFTNVKEVEKALKGLNPDIKVKFDVKDGVKEAQKVIATIQQDGKKQMLEFGQVYGDKSGNAWQLKQVTELDTANSKAAKSVNELVKNMNKLLTEGKITNEQFEKLTGSIANIDKHGGIKGLNAQLDHFVANNKKAEQAVRDQVKAQKEQEAELKRQETLQRQIIENEIKRKNLVLDIERAMKSQSKNIDSGAARKLIEDTKALDVHSKSFSTSLKQNQSALKEMKTNATEATRSNIGLIDSFKVAMEKFPIWMASSTLFYGVIRSAREFGSIIVDIDTKMTNLAKVLSDDVNIEEVFDRGAASAEKFGQSISASLDAMAEFARQGFSGNELGILTDAGLVAANVGEITVQKASEYLTASLIQWKMDAKDAMEIIDSFNEISNNYATTVEKLSQGNARAASTARAMGLDFNELNGIIGTVTAATRQSGNEVG